MHASWLAVSLAMLLTTAAAHAAQEPAPPMRPVPPLPTIGLPLPHIGLPSPAETNAKDGSPRPQRPGRGDADDDGRQGSNGRDRRRQQQPSVVFIPVLPVAPAPPVSTRSDPTVQRGSGPRSGSAGTDDTGTLAFDLQPSIAADVFVDGSYAGTTEIVGEGLELTSGRHTVELRASGFEMRRFEAQIPAGKTVTFRGSLTKSEEPAPPEPVAEATPATPKTFYVVPGCYAGDVPPQQATLPEGCDATLVRTFTR